MHEHARAALAELARRRAPDAVGGPGDQDGLHACYSKIVVASRSLFRGIALAVAVVGTAMMAALPAAPSALRAARGTSALAAQVRSLEQARRRESVEQRRADRARLQAELARLQGELERASIDAERLRRTPVGDFPKLPRHARTD